MLFECDVGVVGRAMNLLSDNRKLRAIVRELRVR